MNDGPYAFVTKREFFYIYLKPSTHAPETGARKKWRQTHAQWRREGVCRPAGANVFVAAPTATIRSPLVMVTTMALLWTVNSTLSWGCNYVMQWNLGWSVATDKKKTAAHTFYTCLCWNKAMSPIRQKRPNFRSPYFCSSKCRPLHSSARADVPPPFPPPLFMPDGMTCSRFWRRFYGASFRRRFLERMSLALR